MFRNYDVFCLAALEEGGGGGVEEVLRCVGVIVRGVKKNEWWHTHQCEGKAKLSLPQPGICLVTGVNYETHPPRIGKSQGPRVVPPPPGGGGGGWTAPHRGGGGGHKALVVGSVRPWRRLLASRP